MAKCEVCGGKGFVEYQENQAPHGSGQVWNETLSESCSACINRGLCPNCGEQLIAPFFAQAMDAKYAVSKAAYKIYRHMQLHGKWFGIKIAPWRGNVGRKIVYHFHNSLTRLSYRIPEIHELIFPQAADEMPSRCYICDFKIPEDE